MQKLVLLFAGSLLSTVSVNAIPVNGLHHFFRIRNKCGLPIIPKQRSLKKGFGNHVPRERCVKKIP